MCERDAKPIYWYLCKISNTERSVLPHVKHRVLSYFTKRTGLFLTGFEAFEIVTRHSEELLFRMYSHDTVHVRPSLSLPLTLLDLFYNITNEWYFKLGAVICCFFNYASSISKLPAWTRKMGIISTGTFATLNCRQSWILDYTPWIPDSRYWIPVFVSGTFWILIVSGIADTLRCIPDSRFQDSGSDNKISSGFSGFHKQKFPVFRNLSDLLLASFGIKTLIIRALGMWYNVASRRVQMTQAHHGSWLGFGRLC